MAYVYNEIGADNDDVNDVPMNNLEAQAPALPVAPAPAQAEVQQSQKKNWFTWGKPKSSAVDDAIVENGTCEKQKWWNRSKKVSEEVQIDMVNRDSKSINNHVQFGFEDVFGEADSQHSWDCVWRLNYRVFSWTRLFVYRLLSLLALPFTIIFAIFFGLVSCFNVFIIVPFAKLLSIPGNCLGLVWNWLIHTIFDPIASSIGLLFSNCRN